MQPNFTLLISPMLKRFCIYLITSFSILFEVANAQVVYQTSSVSTLGVEISSTANGPSTNMGDAIVMAGTSRFVNQVEVKVFTLASTAPFSLTMSMYTDCSSGGAAGACGGGTGTLVPGSVLTVSGITPSAAGAVVTVLFNYVNPINLSGQSNNQVNIVLNASRNDVFWIIDELPTIGSIPSGEPATSFVTRCGSTVAANNGCSRAFTNGGVAINNNFYMKVTAQASSPSCTGTPAPGNTVSSSVSVCPGVNFSLSLQNATSGSGVTFQWQSSSDGTTWTDISGATSPGLTRNQTASTFYRCLVTCSGSTGTSSSLLVAMAPSSACYCTPTYSSGCGATGADAILNVTIPGTTLNNTSACSTPPFTYYSSVPAPVLVAGGTYLVNVRLGGDTFGQHARVWFDWNQDGDFNDAGEAAAGTTASVGANGTASLSITVPATALVGTTRMRVRGADDVAIGATQSCGASSSTWGEAEDYNVSIVPCVQGTFTTQPAAATATCGGNATFTVAASGSVPTYTWQFRTGPTAIWQALPNGGIVSGATTATLVLTDIPDSWNGREFRSIFSGACTGANPSNGAVLTVNRLAATTNVSSASICSGSSQMLSLTNTVSTPTTATFTATSGLPLAIPDDNLTGVSSSVNVSGIPAGSLITNVAVRFSMTHTYVGDIIMNLKAPNGQTLNLVGLLNNGTGGNSSNDFTNTVIDSLSVTPLSGAAAPRTGTFRADRLVFTIPVPSVTPVTTTNWLPLLGTVNGTWSIGICDTYDGDFGTLTAWSIEISYVAPVFAQGTWTATPATPNSMFTDAALTVPYTGTPATTIYVNPAANTSYAVQFTTSTTPCTTTPRVIPVAVGVPMTLTVPATVAACIGSGFTLTGVHAAIPATNAAAIYQWQQSTDGGVSWSSISGATGITLTVPTTTAAMNGRRYRLLSQSGGCAIAVSNTSVLTVNPLPTVTLSAAATSLIPGRTVTINGTSSPAAAANGWSWSLNGSSIAGATATQIVNIDGLGSYQATVRDVNGCINRSNVLAITGEASDKLFIYPNPTVGAFQVRYYHAGDVNEKRTISVYNPLGQLVAVKSFDLTYSTAPYLRMDVDMSGAARGTYVVKVAHEYSGKIVSGLVLVQ